MICYSWVRHVTDSHCGLLLASVDDDALTASFSLRDLDACVALGDQILTRLGQFVNEEIVALVDGAEFGDQFGIGDLVLGFQTLELGTIASVQLLRIDVTDDFAEASDGGTDGFDGTIGDADDGGGCFVAYD